MDQPDPEKLGWFIGYVATAIGGVFAVLKGFKTKIFTGTKVDNLSTKVDGSFKELNDKLNTYFVQDAAHKADITRAVGDLDRRISRVEQRLDT